ncbi:MAG: hypothetical protein EPO36_09720 [Chloroflexota bacterium]|nr:MAG: hypothetical protein EPO36_09720 [Chloroflexota bacterium]
MKTEADFWACSQCRSINPIKSDRCYSCHAPRAVAAVRPTDMSMSSAPAPLAVTSSYRSSVPRAILVTVLTLLFIACTLTALWVAWTIGLLRAEGEREAADRLLQLRLPFFLVVPAVGAVTLLSYAAWISRVVDNLPALGAGYSRVGPTMAFIEPLLPLINVYSLAARAGEVIQKLGGGTHGLALVALAWLLVVPTFGVSAWILRFERYAGTVADFFRGAGLTLLVTFGIQSIGLVVGLWVIWHIESLCSARADGEPSR